MPRVGDYGNADDEVTGMTLEQSSEVENSAL